MIKPKRKNKKSTFKPKWELLHETEKTAVDRLINIYKEDKLKARVLYFQNKVIYVYYRYIKFEKPNGNFDLVCFQITYGISINNKLYKREKKIEAIIYKDKKFWYVTNAGRQSNLRQLNFWSLKGFLDSVYKHDKSFTNSLYLDLLNKFGWLRNIQENEKFWSISFNSILTFKLFGGNDILRYIFKCPLPIAKMLIDLPQKYGNFNDRIRQWKENKKVLINIENLKPELYLDPHFNDTCNMANTLGRKVNCSWGSKRLKEEHDTWAREISKIVMSCEPFIELKIGKMFADFAEFSGYKVFTSNHDLMIEGDIQKHCVGTYVNAVDRGDSGIYHIQGHTLELRKGNFGATLSLTQFRGYRNCDAPIELHNEVLKKLNEFNATLRKDEPEPTIEVDDVLKADVQE